MKYMATQSATTCFHLNKVKLLLILHLTAVR